MTRRSLVARSLLAILLASLSVFLFLTGKGHVLYLDTNSIELGDRKLRAPELSLVILDGKEIGEMGRAERVIAEVAGPSHAIRVEPLDGGEPTVRRLRLPVGRTELVVSIPAIVAGEADELVVTPFVAPPESVDIGANSFRQDESEVIPLQQ